MGPITSFTSMTTVSSRSGSPTRRPTVEQQKQYAEEWEFKTIVSNDKKKAIPSEVQRKKTQKKTISDNRKALRTHRDYLQRDCDTVEAAHAPPTPYSAIAIVTTVTVVAVAVAALHPFINPSIPVLVPRYTYIMYHNFSFIPFINLSTFVTFATLFL